LENVAADIRSTVVAVNATSSVEGASLFILYKIAGIICATRKGSASFDLCGDCDVSSSTTSSLSTKSFSASLVRPKDSHQATRLFNLFGMICSAAGITHTIALSTFLEDAYFEPINNGLHWAIAFECVILYLRMVEAQPNLYHISTVLFKSGGMDAIRSEALSIAKTHYPAEFFRGLGGNPRDGPAIVGDQDKTFSGRILGDTGSSTRGCAAWNLGNPHLNKHVENGRCKFKHACDQFVSDKGPFGQCLGNHKRADCDYDTDKKVAKPVKN